MPISLKTDLEWGDKWFIKSDPDQLEHYLVAVVILPGKAVKFRLSYMGEECEVFDFECTKEKDVLKSSSEDD